MSVLLNGLSNSADLAKYSLAGDEVFFYRSRDGVICGRVVSVGGVACEARVVGLAMRYLNSLTNQDAQTFLQGIALQRVNRSVPNSPRECEVAMSLQAKAPSSSRSHEERQPLWALRGHTSTVRDLTYSPDGGSLFTRDADGTLYAWRIHSGQLMWSDSDCNATCFAVSSDGSQLMSGHEDTAVRLRCLTDGESFKHYMTYAAAVRTLAYANEDRWGVAGGENGFIHIFDLTAEGHECRFIQFFKFEAWTAAHGPFSRFTFLTSGNLFSYSEQFLVEMPEFVQQIEARKLDMNAVECDAPLLDLINSESHLLTFSPEGEGIVLLEHEGDHQRATLNIEGVVAVSLSLTGDVLALLQPGLFYSSYTINQTKLGSIFNSLLGDSVSERCGYASIILFRNGHRIARILYPKQVVGLRISPDEQSLALVIAPTGRSGSDVDIIELDTEAEMRRNVSEKLQKLAAAMQRIRSECSAEDKPQVTLRLREAIKGWIFFANDALKGLQTQGEKGKLYMSLMGEIAQISTPGLRKILQCNLGQEEYDLTSDVAMLVDDLIPPPEQPSSERSTSVDHCLRKILQCNLGQEEYDLTSDVAMLVDDLIPPPEQPSSERSTSVDHSATPLIPKHPTPSAKSADCPCVVS